MIIGINCGHTVSGQPGCGAVGRIDESVETRHVGKKLIELLLAQGNSVVDCTNDYAESTGANLAEICRLANKQYLDLFVSIHFNAGGGRGTEVYTYGGRTFNAAEDACRNIAALGFNNRGIKDGSNLYVLRHTSARAMLVEVCFVDTDDADKYLKLGADKIATAICEAITGTKTPTVTQTTEEYTSTNDIIWELHHRGVISDKALWTGYCGSDVNVYWFCRKLCQYVRTKTRVESEKNEYEDIGAIVWDLHHRGIISDAALWTAYMKRDTNVYWLLRKGLHWCRTH